MRTKRRPFQGNVINLRSAHIRFTQRTTGTRTGLVGAGLCSARRRALVLTGISGGYECSFLLVCTGRCLLDPFGSSEFAEEFQKNRCILRADRVVRPYRIRGIEVSVQGPATLSAHLADTNLPQRSVKTGAFCAGRCRHRPPTPNAHVHTDSPRLSKDSGHPAGRSRAPPLPTAFEFRRFSRIMGNLSVLV